MRAATALAAGLVLGTMAGPASPVRADHIGVLQLNGDPAGPYAVSAWTQPSPVRVDAGTVTVAVMQPRSRVALTDVRVRVTAARVDGAGAPVAVDASRGQDPLGIRYLADLPLPTAGRWLVRIGVQGPAGAGTVDFPLEVEAASRSAWPLVAPGAAALVGLAFWWTLRARRQRGSRPRA